MMPKTPQEWAWWILSVIVVGAILSILANLASNWLQKFLDRHFEQRRKRRLAYNRFEAEYVEKMAKLAESDSTVLTAMASLVDVWQTRAIKSLMYGLAATVTGVIISASSSSYRLFDVGAEFALVTNVVGVIGSLAGLLSIRLSIQLQKSADIYSAVIFAYHEKHHIPKVAGNDGDAD